MKKLTAKQRRALQEAAEWHARQSAGDADEQDEQRLQRWRARDPSHEWAWQRVLSLQAKLGHLPGELADETLTRAERRLRLGRRGILKGGLLLIGAGSAGWAGYHHGPGQRLLADHATASGQLKTLSLADNSTLILNTASAVDIRFTGQERRLFLKQGEIMLHTAPAPPGGAPGPFIAETPSGQARALGTRFSLRYLDDQARTTRLNVYQGQVQVTARNGQQQDCGAGQRLRFTRQFISRPDSPTASDAWTRQRLEVKAMRLDEFVTELARYRSGWIRIDPAVARYRITGVFNTADTDQALRALTNSFPLKITYRSRYWVTISPLTPAR